MIITKIGFDKKFGMPNYGSDHPLVIEAMLEPGETKEEAWSKMNQDMIEWHKKEYPHLYLDFGLGHEGVIQVEKDLELDKELAMEIAILETYKYKEEAEAYLSKSTFKYRPELKVIVNNKESKPIK